MAGPSTSSRMDFGREAQGGKRDRRQPIVMEWTESGWVTV